MVVKNPAAGLESIEVKGKQTAANGGASAQKETKRSNNQAPPSIKSGKQDAEAGSAGKKPAKKIVVKKANIMEHLDKVDGACEYFHIINRENEEI